jgi:hypothetical protein
VINFLLYYKLAIYKVQPDWKLFCKNIGKFISKCKQSLTSYIFSLQICFGNKRRCITLNKLSILDAGYFLNLEKGME